MVWEKEKNIKYPIRKYVNQRNRVDNKNFLINRGWINFDQKEKSEINLLDETNIIGTLKLQTKEVASIHEMPVQDILDNADQLLFTPDSLDALRHYAEKRTQALPSDPL